MRKSLILTLAALLASLSFVQWSWGAASYAWTERQPAAASLDQLWKCVATSADGSRLVAASYGGRLYTSTDSGTSWTERQPAGDLARNWTCLAMSSDGTKLLAGVYGGRLYSSADSGGTWTERQPAGNVNALWNCAAMAADGSNLIVGAYGGRLYTSANLGANWTERQPAGNTGKTWQCLDMSADGTKVVAGVNGGRLYTSADSGATWTERQPAGNMDRSWYCAGISSDGANLIAGVNGGRLYTSTDSGATWLERQPVGDVNASWASAATSDNGTQLTVGIANGRLYLSGDSGATWSERQPAGAVNETWAVAMSGDGTKQIVGAWFGRLYTSTDSGATWSETQPTASIDKSWQAVASSSDGVKLVAAVTGGRLYTSANSGANWTERQPAGNVDKAWRCVASSPDGTRLIAGISSGRLYTSADSGASWTERKPAGDVDKAWQCAGTSSDGTKPVAAVTGGRLYTSTTSGATWTERQPAGNADKAWQTLAVSSDGAKIVAAVAGGRLYTSPDSGATWTECRPAGDADKNWQSVAMSPDGTKILAAVSGGRLYVSTDSGATWVETRPAGAFDFSWQCVGISADGTRLLAGTFGGRVYMSIDCGTTWTESQPIGNLGNTWQCLAMSSDGSAAVVGAAPGRFFTGAFVAVVPTLTTTAASSILNATATSGGNITSDGGSAVTARGVCWSTNANPTTADSHTTDNPGTGVFTSSLAGLTANTLYHLRAYATNGVGTAYGNDQPFTSGAYPMVVTTAVTNIAATTADSGGNVTDNGGAAITVRGVCWSTSANPTAAGSHTTDGAGNGVFISNIAGLSPGTFYHVRAYASNGVATGYGNDTTFTTATTVPTVTTTAASDVAFTTATVGGNVTATGGATVTTRGVCWSTNVNPTTADSHAANGSEVGAFPIGLTGLTPNTQYHFRAYATNSAGTAYGNDLTFTTNPLAVPTLTTVVPGNIMSTSAASGGNITSDGGQAVTARGVCWSTNANPTTADNHTTDGSGTGAFTSSITGLTSNTLYHVRAYATNAQGTGYGGDETFTTVLTVVPTVTTAAASDITAISATAGGNVTSAGGVAVTARGVCWSTAANPTIAGSHTNDGNGTGAFTSNITGLTPSTLYHLRAYATNSVGTAYGNEVTFTTIIDVPTVTTTPATDVTVTAATCGGAVVSDGGQAVTARGVCWSTAANPTIADNHTADGAGTGSFTSSITGLTTGVQYHVRAYATNSVGTGYGVEVTFVAAMLPVLTTSLATNITAAAAVSGGNISSDGGAFVTARGVCWSETANPTIADSHSTDGTGTGSFSSSLSGLSARTAYHIRAYATNGAGTGYGNDVTFTTLAAIPTVTTAAITNITSTAASGGGEVTADGGLAVTARGVCWSTAANPSTANSHTTDGTGTSSFTSSITGLAPDTRYYVRAYATNNLGTSYGQEQTFITSDTIPTVSTLAPHNITVTTARVGGNVLADGGSSVTACGVCWSTSDEPTLADNHTLDGSGIGSFVSNLTGLAAGTTYFVRAYATNSAGTSYGNAVTLTTLKSSITPATGITCSAMPALGGLIGLLLLSRVVTVSDKPSRVSRRKR